MTYTNWETAQGKYGGEFMIECFVASTGKKTFAKYLKYGIVHMARRGNFGNLKRLLDRDITGADSLAPPYYYVRRIIETQTGQVVLDATKGEK